MSHIALVSSKVQFSRRDFIIKAGVASCAAAVCSRGAVSSFAAEKSVPPIVAFAKIYQELNLNFDDSAAITGEAGLDGIDCPVRPGGQILPERAAEDLPRYAQALTKRGLSMPLITTAITSVSSANAEEVLRTAKKLGVQFYRLGFIYRKKDVAVEKQLAEIRAEFKDLAALNKEIGIGGLVQNHSGGTYLGGDLSDLLEMVRGFDPAQLGVAFDIGHALIVHGDKWREHFEKLKSHLRVAYVKDARREGGWVPFGEGELGRIGYFKLLNELGYHAPISLHIEYDWSDKGKSRDRATLVNVLRKSSEVLKRWLAEG